MAAPSVRVRRAGGWRPGVVFFGLFVLPFAGWVYYNSWDQPLDPQAKAVLASAPERIADEENLFLALLAFPIEGQERAHERGAAALAAQAKAAASGVAATSYADALGRLSARVDTAEVELCSLGNDQNAYRCLASSRAQREAFAPLLNTFNQLLLRYRELELYPRYADPRPYPPDISPDASALRIAQLNLSIVALALDEGADTAALTSLARSAAVWRRVLAARDATLVDKMVASRAYVAHLLFVSELIREHGPTLQGEGAAAIDSILRPLAEAERSLVGALAGEFRMQAAMWEQLADPSSAVVRKDLPDTSAWWYRLLTKKNDSINRSWRSFEKLMEIEHGGCTAVRREVEAAATRRESKGYGLRWYEWLYNPIGRVLHGSVDSVPILIEMLGRQCNLVALQGMVALQHEMQRSGQDAATLANRFIDPNAGAPYVFDAQAQTLGFHFIGAREEFLTPLPLVARVPE